MAACAVLAGNNDELAFELIKDKGANADYVTGILAMRDYRQLGNEGFVSNLFENGCDFYTFVDIEINSGDRKLANELIIRAEHTKQNNPFAAVANGAVSSGIL